MATPPTPTFLGLPQELRDCIYDYALHAEHRNPAVSQAALPCAAWTIHFNKHHPQATFLSLTQCNRQLWREITAYLAHQARPTDVPAKLNIHTAYPDMTTQWSCIPRPPTTQQAAQDLLIRIKMRKLFEPALSTPHQHDVLLRPLFDILRRFIFRGPHSARARPLRQPLRLRTVRVELISAIPFEELVYVYGSPAVQLEVLFGHLKALVARLARSGLLNGAVAALEVCLDGQKTDQIPVTSDSWDERDHVFFANAGFRWDPV
ncbi:hypothetical protein B0A55_01233 [Friedmanniomyces simplex]|uniref:F-box domain-containing protein n=1 Tax=Friedmanniomyces simplex TaxID=329884 RepID=A0A4U0Y0G6_9PEZI|nr:hypothetical protein B0A55_01233 [Friedmanniomyces simplex]